MPTKVDYHRMLAKLQARHVTLLTQAVRLAKGHDRVHKEKGAAKCAADSAKREKSIAQIHCGCVVAPSPGRPPRTPA
jgi:hypothetical protein